MLTVMLIVVAIGVIVCIAVWQQIHPESESNAQPCNTLLYDKCKEEQSHGRQEQGGVDGMQERKRLEKLRPEINK